MLTHSAKSNSNENPTRYASFEVLESSPKCLSSKLIPFSLLSFSVISLTLIDLNLCITFHDPTFPIILIASYILFCKQILQLSGDIESNPGPLQEVRVVHVNARSLSTKVDLFTAESHAFDIITVSETWLSDNDLNDNLLLPHFHPPVRQDRLGDRHGGVAIYVRNTLVCKPRPDLHVHGLEAVWVETKLGQQSFLVGSFYRPDSPVQYWELIAESISKANDTLLNYIVLGDFNTDYLHNPSHHLVSILTRYQLEQLVTFPTRVTDNTSTCLDLIITQSPFLVKDIEDHPPFCSDHNAPCVTLLPRTNNRSSFKRTIYNYNKLDRLKLNDLLQKENWNSILNDFTIDESSKIFTETLTNIIKECVPNRTVTIRSTDAPWFKHDLKTKINRRNKLYKKAKRSNTREDWNNFHALRNEIVGHIRKQKLDYYNELNDKINGLQVGQKEWWKIVKTFLNKKGIDSNEIPPLTVDGHTYYSNIDKAETFNNFFTKQCNLDNEDDPLPIIETNESEINKIHLTSSEVKNVLKSLDASKATGPDQIPNKVLALAADIIAIPLSNFFNRCLNECKFPTIWKMANVTPIYKKGNKGDCSNYRPVSLLSCVGKAFERCVHKHVYQYLTSNKCITEFQSGFVEGDSTVNQLLSIYNDYLHNYDNNITTQAVFFDISKAFDRVWHKGLLHKLNAIGIRGNLLQWFRDYLNDRTQCVVIKGEKSIMQPVKAGVPQGSVLGPLLFLVYINDIVENIESVIKLFADDTSTSLSMKNPDMRKNILNSDLNKINKWACSWKVKFNEKKTELINIKRGSSPVLDLTFGNQTIAGKDNHKHLGVIIQTNLKWDEHIHSTVRKTSLLINCLRSFKHKLSRKALEIMYKSFILPILDYADVIWDNCAEYLADLLEDLHMDALRTITGSVRGTSHAKLLVESGFCSLRERRRRHKIILFFKIINGTCPAYLSNLAPPLVSTINPYHRRRPLERLEPMCKTELYHKSFIPSTTAIWNKLPDYVKSFNSISQIKSYLRSSDTIVPPYYYRGDRREQILHCRLRIGMSDLCFDLWERHLIADPSCACQDPNETAEHFLLYCPNFINQRMNTISKLPTYLRTVDTLLFGSCDISLQDNELIFDTTFEYIKLSSRFD